MTLKERLNQQQVAAYYRSMLLIRRFEDRAAQAYMMGKVRGFLHLYSGEEAIAVGVMSVLNSNDYIITHYRDHGHALARGMDPKAAMAELFGKATGCSRGMGGSMHLFDASLNFMGGYAIVGGQFPLATGLALASSYKGTDQVTVCFFGDGALNEGEFHEAMNLAAVWKLPILFLLENNLYGMGTRVDRTYAGGHDVYKASAHYSMEASVVDGMDVLAVRDSVSNAVNHIRQGNGPYFLEAKTYRFQGHSMADPGEYRDKDEEAYWQARDPIATMRKQMIEEDLLRERDARALEEEVDAVLDEAVKFADESPFPSPEALYENVYAS